MVVNPFQHTLGFLLSDTARLLRKRFEQRSRHLGFTRSQWQTLSYLANAEGTQQSALADMLDLEPITLARTVDRLESAGLVERRRHPKDRRVWRLFLSAKAHVELAGMFDLGEATRADALENLSPQEAADLNRILKTMKVKRWAV